MTPNSTLRQPSMHGKMDISLAVKEWNNLWYHQYLEDKSQYQVYKVPHKVPCNNRLEKYTSSYNKLLGVQSLLSIDMQASIAQKMVKVKEEQGVMRASSKGTHFSLTWWRRCYALTQFAFGSLFCRKRYFFSLRPLVFLFLQ